MARESDTNVLHKFWFIEYSSWLLKFTWPRAFIGTATNSANTLLSHNRRDLLMEPLKFKEKTARSLQPYWGPGVETDPYRYHSNPTLPPNSPKNLDSLLRGREASKSTSHLPDR